MPADQSPTFSPAWWPRPQLRSRFGPLVWEMKPCAAMRAALLRATLARQEFQVSGPRPLRARSWLIKACWVEPMTIAGGGGGGAVRAGAAGAAAAGAGGGGGGVGSGVGLGIMRSGAGSLTSTTSFGPTMISFFAAGRVWVELECAKTTRAAPVAGAPT